LWHIWQSFQLYSWFMYCRSCSCRLFQKVNDILH
jgi:hypothetical protein